MYILIFFWGRGSLKEVKGAEATIVFSNYPTEISQMQQALDTAMELKELMVKLDIKVKKNK